MEKPKQNQLTTLLRWSEQYTKTDMVYLIHGGSWLGLAQLIASISGFIITYVLANSLTPEMLGEYRFLLAGFTLISIFTLPGMRTALRESVPKGYRGNLPTAFRVMNSWGTLGSLTAVGVALYYFANQNLGLATGFLCIAFIVPFYNASTCYLEYLTALKKLRDTTLYTSIGRVATLLTTVAAIFLLPHYAWIILSAYLLGTLLPNLWFHYKTVRNFHTAEEKIDPGITRYAMHITAMTALGLIAGQLDKFFIWNIVGAEGLAIFFIAYTIPLAITAQLNIIPTLAFAKFGEKDPALIRQTLLPKLGKYFGAIAITTGIYMLIAPSIFTWFFPQYLGALNYSLVLALIPLFSALSPIKTYLTITKSTKELYLLSIIPPTLRIATAFFLIIPFGLWDAVYSLLIEKIASSILLLFYFLRSNRN